MKILYSYVEKQVADWREIGVHIITEKEYIVFDCPLSWQFGYAASWKLSQVAKEVSCPESMKDYLFNTQRYKRDLNKLDVMRIPYYLHVLYKSKAK